MKLVDIQHLMNEALAGELLSFREMLPHLNYALDEINTNLNTIYPEFKIEEGIQEYNHFEDRYIRMVVIPGAAWHFYVADEEGMQTAPQYQIEFQKGLFFMLRDTVHNIPDQYKAHLHQGTTSSEFARGDRGLWIDGSNFQI